MISVSCFVSESLQVGTIISEKIPVTVAYMSAFTPTPTSPLRVAAGRAAVFDFPPISSVPLPAVTWQADDGSGLHGQKYETTTDNRLVILSVDSGDNKKYRYGQYGSLLPSTRADSATGVRNQKRTFSQPPPWIKLGLRTNVICHNLL